MMKHDVPAEVLCFEITETAAIANIEAATQFMHELKFLGCRFALDDFGSGLSSFGYLKNLPVDYLKIDGSFVRNMDTDAIDRAMVSSIHQLASVIGIKTIAEFVENDSILEQLADIGIGYAQGYGISRPSPLQEKDISSKQSA
jgi:EAL domain-containing protein (putative c-di-GMP-specific phosphodiesterase class I)